MKKRILAIILALSVVFATTACTNPNASTVDKVGSYAESK